MPLSTDIKRDLTRKFTDLPFERLEEIRVQLNNALKELNRFVELQSKTVRSFEQKREYFSLVEHYKDVSVDKERGLLEDYLRKVEKKLKDQSENTPVLNVELGESIHPAPHTLKNVTPPDVDSIGAISYGNAITPEISEAESEDQRNIEVIVGTAPCFTPPSVILKVVSATGTLDAVVHADASVATQNSSIRASIVPDKQIEDSLEPVQQSASQGAKDNAPKIKDIRSDEKGFQEALLARKLNLRKATPRECQKFSLISGIRIKTDSRRSSTSSTSSSASSSDVNESEWEIRTPVPLTPTAVKELQASSTPSTPRTPSTPSTPTPSAPSTPRFEPMISFGAGSASLQNMRREKEMGPEWLQSDVLRDIALQRRGQISTGSSRKVVVNSPVASPVVIRRYHAPGR